MPGNWRVPDTTLGLSLFPPPGESASPIAGIDKGRKSESGRRIRGHTGPPGTAETDSMRGILERCEIQGLRMTEQRRVIAGVLEDSEDHPDAMAVLRRAQRVDPGISIATVYRTLRLFEDTGILERHEFRDGRTRYEDAERDHHDHLIDLGTGEVIEFTSQEIEELQKRIAASLGYQIVAHRLELYGVRIDESKDPDPQGSAPSG